jgi:D-alanyl-D-alanine carboxypeptidase
MLQSEADIILKSVVEQHQSPSVQYYFFDKDTSIKQCSAGFANIKSQHRADDTTTYNAYSTTKTFTALALLQLEAKGKIDLNKPAAAYLPNFTYGNEVTVRQILNHTAGIPNPIPLNWIHLAAEHQTFDCNSFFQSILDKHKKPKSKPNEKFAYTNLGYVLAGQLLEKVSGLSYEQYISEHILAHLPLNHGDLSFEITNAEKHAKGYHKNFSFTNLILGLFINKSKYMSKPEGKWKPFNFFYVNGTAYGGLLGRPIGFVKYIQEFLKDDSSLILPQYKQQLFTENKTNNQKSTGMCLSWFTGELNGVQFFTHAGGGGGYYCEIRVYPSKGLGSVIFFNRTGMTDERFLDKVDRYFI